MASLLIVVEGKTEQEFVRLLLGPWLEGAGFERVEPRLLKPPGGGICSWLRAKREITNHLKGHPGAFVTTMFDFYAMPVAKQNAWPGRVEARKMNGAANKGAYVQSAVAREIIDAMGSRFNSRRFLPFVTMHEFEGLLFSDCAAIGRLAENADVARLEAVRKRLDSPEDINESPSGAPSKWLDRLVPGYDKALHGPLIALETGLDRIRAECPHFHSWLTKLEALARSRS
ncbi:MAG: DUF4276 family protein [Bryobacteraceae bacterium]